jgi:putative heme-binding domain-containing protein
MKLSLLPALCALLLPLSGFAQDGFTPLFNGRDLSGWEGDPKLWKVENGAIVGTCSGPDSPEHNTFLIWRGGQVKDFELRATVRVEGDNNSGIQYRSRRLEGFGPWAITGYQCDIHPAVQHTAMTYEEKGRGIFGLNGQSVVVDPTGSRWLVAEHDPVQVDVSQWQEYTVIARGNHLIHQVNGRLTSELTDYDEKNRALEGLLAIQLHRGNANRVFVKDIRIRPLTDAKVIPFEKSNIPSDAQRIEKPVTRNPQGITPAPAPKAAAPKGKALRQAAVGPAIGENKATPVSRIKALPGFEVELLYSVPGGEQGSWVALAQDDQGRIYASDQYGDLYRFNAPAAGQPLREADVKKLPLNIRAINGMVFAFGALYAGVNDYEQKTTSGLYRITDSNGDGDLDQIELLRAFESKSDHGVHKVLPTPDGKGLYLITGNNAIIEGGPVDGTSAHSPVPKIWGDDHLLPRMPDGRGHNRHVLAPGGIVYRLDPDGKTFEIFASGFRNIYGGSVNRDGELFTYDADMEYDFNTSWYRPTRVNHVVSGGEYGWRNGAGKYPEFYPDNLPATLNIGPGSPTGTTFGYGAKFPAKYQEAFYVLDWSWGKLYAVHLQENGASYTATKEEFITGAPLPLTDAFIGKDGAMYFAIGGRRVQSGLYRVTYAGKESTAPVTLTPRPSPLRDLRHQLEAFHGKQDPKAIDAAWPHLNHSDRFIRWAARTVLEHQPPAAWQERALKESEAGRQLEALLALARVAGKCPSHRPEDFLPDTDTRNALLAALLQLDFARLTPEQQITHVRTLQITLHRFGDPEAATIQKLIAQLDPAYPAPSFELNWLLTETLAHLQAPNTAAKALALIDAAPAQEPQIEFARSLRHLRTGWTREQREKQLEWFLKAASFRGGASFSKFIEFIRTDSLATFTDDEKTQLAELIEKKPEVKSAYENVGAIFAGRTPTMWTLEQLSAAASNGLKNRDFDNGRKMFGAAACFACHRFDNAGGMTGPDLTGAGGRYSAHDLLDQIINPSKEINEQFAPIIVTKNSGEIISGIVVNLNGDTVTLNTDLSDPDQRATIDRKEVKSIEVSKVSPMPPMLLNMLTQDEILDLLAYVLSGGDRSNAMFKN